MFCSTQGPLAEPQLSQMLGLLPDFNERETGKARDSTQREKIIFFPPLLVVSVTIPMAFNTS